ncbi:MAG: hypothetical protein WCE90_02645 [Candidatus Zixiibacteriota bacterium]
MVRRFWVGEIRGTPPTHTGQKLVSPLEIYLIRPKLDAPKDRAKLYLFSRGLAHWDRPKQSRADQKICPQLVLSTLNHYC